MRRGILLIGLPALALAGGGVAAALVASPPEGEAVVDALEGAPAATFDDWASYADAVVVLSVVEEGDFSATETVESAREGMVTRSVTVQVDEVLWQHEASAPVPSAEFSFPTAGWIVAEGRRTPMRYEGSERLEVGSSYVMPLVDYETEGWGPLVPSAARLLEGGGELAPLDTTHPTGGVPAATGGMTPEQVAAGMADATPDPVAEANRDLRPADRFAAVAAAE